MGFRQRFRPPRHLAVLLLTATVVPAAALGWLGWRILQQDRELENQHIHGQLENAADLVAAGLDRRLLEIEERLAGTEGSLPDDLAAGALYAIFRPAGVEAYPEERLLYRPSLPPLMELPPDVFSAGQVLEFQQRDYEQAAEFFRKLARSDGPHLRAAALLRLARNLRKSKQHETALSVYKELEQLDKVRVGGSPASLVALHASCAVLEELNRTSELRTAARALHNGLQHGRWILDRASYEFHLREALRWLAGDTEIEPGPPDALALASAVEFLWRDWEEGRLIGENARGRRSFRIGGQPVLLVWRATAEILAALVAGPRYLESEWQGLWRAQRVRLFLTDSEGRRVFGQPSEGDVPEVVRTTADTPLPWNLYVTSADAEADLARLAGRRRLLFAGLAIMALVVVAAGYFTARAATRELAVARMQSDFVSAVSHEFRSPLTSMRHLTELLEGGVISNEERRRQYYGVLSRETRRLHRLVEGLLNFGRMEAGVVRYQFENVDPAGLVRDVVAEFREEYPDGSGHITVDANSDLPAVRADREAMGRAVWNLLDNAVKYSTDTLSVQVTLACEGERVAIHVSDQGPGIPVHEQKEIFRKFVRGSTSRGAGTKGTGIGLSLVQHIVAAHNGEVRLDSEPGRGSTFTILLPGVRC